MRKKEVKPIDKSFQEPQPVSGGNAFETYVATKVQDEYNKATMMNKKSMDSIMDDIEDAIKDYITDTTPKWWILMQEQANYFCNQFMWKIDDTLLKSQIINIIRCSFYNGVAGMYYNDITNKFEAVALSNINYNSGGEIVDAKYTLANQYLSGIDKKWDKEFVGVAYIPKSKIKNLAIFKWGTEATNAWLRIRPYVMKQELMLKMMSTQLFTYIKKFTYNCMNPSAIKSEIKAFFNPTNPFLIHMGLDGNGLNRFSEVKVGDNTTALELVEYYEKQMNIIYSQIGRRQNVDVKKERNISSEVEASQENYDILFKDTNTQFSIFVENANEILTRNNKPKIVLLLEDVIEKEQVNDEIQRDNKFDRSTTDN